MAACAHSQFIKLNDPDVHEFPHAADQSYPQITHPEAWLLTDVDGCR
jgi:hypothetical protein